MSDKPADATAAQQIELAIGQLNSLSTLPEVAARFFSLFSDPAGSQELLPKIIESDPALSAKIFELFYQQNPHLTNGSLTVGRAVEKLSANFVRDAVLSVKIFQSAQPDSQRDLPRKQFALHSLAVACAAGEIAQIVSPQIDPQTAYSAGMLHNIGLLALDQAMPKSFARIIKQAKAESADLCQIEKQHLGIDHTLLGKRLAQKWHFPEEIALAIWLYRTSTDSISKTFPKARIAQIVQLAYLIARQCGIGQSGSYNSPDSTTKIAKSLDITSDQIHHIRKILPDMVAQKAAELGLDSPNIAITYSDAAHTATAKLAIDNTKLSTENRRLQNDSTQFVFIADFLSAINANTAPIELAEEFAVCFQKFYQTGPVCLYLLPSPDANCIKASVVNRQSKSRMILTGPENSPAIPESLNSTFAVTNAHPHCQWIFDQLEVDFAAGRTKILPLISKGKAIGAVVFELRYPADSDQLAEKFRSPAATAASVLDMAVAAWNQQNFAEKFSYILADYDRTEQDQPAPEPVAQTAEPAESPDILRALTEMAAGAAHELNNPLSVISGRAQLLNASETDPEKKQILSQIQQNSAQLTRIIEDLMNFAQPAEPRKSRINIKQVLDEAVQLTSQRKDIDQPDIRLNGTDEENFVSVDSAQIVSAIANIFCNCLESYADDSDTGLIDVVADSDGETVRLLIADKGCGMDPDTLKKAAQPFFSEKPAGRKRGMGLAHANRLIKLNKGTLDIQSQPGRGTTVTITLPCK